MNWIDFAINVGMSAMLIALKDPQKIAQYRKAMLKLFRAIGTAFASDEEFVWPPQ